MSQKSISIVASPWVDQCRVVLEDTAHNVVGRTLKEHQIRVGTKGLETKRQQRGNKEETKRKQGGNKEETKSKQRANKEETKRTH